MNKIQPIKYKVQPKFTCVLFLLIGFFSFVWYGNSTLIVAASRIQTECVYKQNIQRNVKTLKNIQVQIRQIVQTNDLKILQLQFKTSQVQNKLKTAFKNQNDAVIEISSLQDFLSVHALYSPFKENLINYFFYFC